MRVVAARILFYCFVKPPSRAASFCFAFGAGRLLLATGATAQQDQNEQRQANRGGYQVFGDDFRRHNGLYKTGLLESALSCKANVQEN